MGGLGEDMNDIPSPSRIHNRSLSPTSRSYLPLPNPTKSPQSPCYTHDSSSSRSRSRSRSPSTKRHSSLKRSTGDERDIKPGNVLYVANICIRVDENELKKKFGECGRVSKCKLVRDPRTDESRGFGFITMATDEDANEAIRKLENYEFGGRRMSVEKARRQKSRSPTPGRYLGVRPRDTRDPRDRGGYEGRGYGDYPPYPPRQEYYGRDRPYYGGGGDYCDDRYRGDRRRYRESRGYSPPRQEYNRGRPEFGRGRAFFRGRDDRERYRPSYEERDYYRR